MSEKLFDIEEELKKLPRKPGVYIMHDEDDRIIYVGKAVILHNRVRSYFRDSTVKSAKISRMVKQIAWFEYVVTGSELEALVLENNLIKEHQPRYNTMLKDDKTYPYIKVTTGEPYPRILFTRLVKNDRSKYFGPYTSAASVKDTIEFLKKHYKLRNCNSMKEEGCLYYHLHRCEAPCMGLISREEYNERIEEVIDFLNGNYKPLMDLLTERMQEASERLDFENAALIRDLLESVRLVAQKQRITDAGGDDKDVIALARDDKSVIIQVFFVRGGKIIGREHFYMKNTEGAEDPDLIKSFVTQFYSGTPFIPNELIVPDEFEDMELTREWLSEKRGRGMRITVPQKGKKEKLVRLAKQNAGIVLKQDIDKIKRMEARTLGAVREIEELIGIGNIKRMEAYDISNISGFNSVGSMVVFENGRAKKNDYRKFNIKSVEGPNDYASMREVLTRRFEHGLNNRDKKDSFSALPDLILMDGGKGQVNIAEEVLSRLELDIPVCGMVKDDRHRTRGLYFRNEEIPILSSSEGFKLITRIQDEAHRFAIEFHRSKRSASQVHSVLDDIPGIGEKRRKALMKHFESIEDIKAAGEESLMAVPSIDKKAARNIYDFFHKGS